MEVFLCWTYNDKETYRLCTSEAEAQGYQRQLENGPGSRAYAEGCAHFRIEPLTPCLEHFSRLVRSHDLTYMMSDDGAVHRRGDASFQRIATMAQQLPQADVVRIWNAWVDEHGWSDEQYRQQWYWKGNTP